MAEAGKPRVVILYGPKAVGKSLVADILGAHFGVMHVDADAVVRDLLSQGIHPTNDLGWLAHVEKFVRAALEQHADVSVEATGAYHSDWLLQQRLTAAGVDLIPVWIWAPEEVSLRRLSSRRTPGRVAVSQEEARRIHRVATEQARHRTFRVRLDTTDRLRVDDVVEAVRPVLK